MMEDRTERLNVQKSETLTALGVWRDSLVNLTGVNRLIKFRPSKTGSVSIESPDVQKILSGLGGSVLWSFVGSEDSEDASIEGPGPVHENLRATPPRRSDGPNTLRTPRADKDLGPVLRNLMRRANTEFLDRGLHVLYIALGMLEWVDDDGTAMSSPLLLVPVTLESQGPKTTPRLRGAEDDPVLNPAVALRLRDFGISLPTVDDMEDNNLETLFAKVLVSVQKHVGWKVEPTAVLSCFSFHKEAMYRDLLDNEDAVLNHPVVRALANTDPTKQTDELMFDEIDPSDIDRDAPPENTPMVLDADSSQRSAIAAAIAGHSFVMDGPPGTGKSQTIANMIGALLHSGKTVLFVSEKAAALEVVRNRLADAGLENYLLELHSHKASRKEVAAALSLALDNVPVPPKGMDGLSRNSVIERRKQLNAYAEAINEERAPLAQSLHQVFGTLANLNQVPSAPIPETPPADLTQAAYQGITDVTRQLERAWRPAAQGQSYLWRDVIDRGSLEIRLYQAQSALEELEGIASINREVMDVFGLTRPSDAATLVSLIELQDGRPTAVRDDWLTVEDWSQVSRSRQALEEDLTRIETAERAVVDAAGVDWRTLPRPETIPESPGAMRLSPEPIHLDTLSTDELDELASKFESHASMLQSRLDSLRGLGSILGLPEVVSFADAERVALLISIRFGHAVPRRHWLNEDGLTSARNASQHAATLISNLDLAERDASTTFSEAVLQAPVADLNSRFAEVHKGLHKLSGEYRADKKLTASLLAVGVTLNDAIRNLPKAVTWATAKAEYDSAAPLISAHLGKFWSGRTTDFSALNEVIETAETVNRNTVPGASEAIEIYLCDGEPNFALKALVDDIRKDFASWRATLDPAPRLEAPPELLLVPIEKAIEWLNCQVEPMRAAARRISAVQEATGTRLNLTKADRFLSLCDAASAAHDQIRINAESHTLAFAGLYQGARTDADAIGRAIKWAEDARRISGGPLIQARLKAIDDLRSTEQLHPALQKWKNAQGRILAAFDESRRDDLSSELDDYEYAPMLIQDFKDDSTGQDEWFAYTEAREELSRRGLGVAIDFCIEQNILPNEVPKVLERALLRAWADDVINRDSRLRPTLSEDRNVLVEEYRDLDKQLVIAATSEIIRSANSRRPAATSVGEPGVIRREGMKKSKHLPVRDLIGKTRSTSLAIKPCFMMSPLAVSQYLPSNMNFDVVIFDEASQVTPGDAINCIYRGKALILAGDDKQLPPSSFFERVVDDSESEEDTDIAEFQSILELSKGCGAFNNLGLKWHYRSRHEGLIAFSNHKFYEGSLVTYPSSHSEGPDVGVEFYLADGVYRRGSTADNPLEAAKVAERVIEHFTYRPHLTLGVVTFSVAQADAIVDAVDKAREEWRDLDRYFDTADRLDSFFIKSLESVQGDERDVILFSIGYGPDEAGKVSANFGAYNKPKGWRRLNVAITRARHRVEVVASMRAGDIPTSQNENVQYLQAYLDYAERGQASLGLALGPSGLGPESPFEESVINAIRSWGYVVEPQVGAAGFRIDIGVRHPAHPGVFALGVECDGYQYHSAPAARDRDRLRDQVLRGLGWRLHRIWGTAWYRNRAIEEERLKVAINAALLAPADGRISSNKEYIARPEVTTTEVEQYSVPTWTTDYVTATIDPLPRWIDPAVHGSRFDMSQAMVEMAKVEGPVHISLIHQRLREAWNIGRISHYVRDNIDAAINLADVIREGDFIDLPSRELSAVRRPSTEVNRTSEQVHDNELGLAMTFLIRDAGSIEQDDLVVATARIFGWNRTGADIGRRLNSALQRLIVRGTLIDSKGAISAAP